jgi:DNA-binding response OmpR family regulator
MPSERMQFGTFVLDVDRYELTHAGKPVRMERIPMDLLILLVRENGRLVSREEIIERLWGKNLYFDSDNSINTAVRKIRNSLGDDAETRNMSKPCSGKGIVSRAMQSLLLKSRPCRSRQSDLGPCLPFFPSKI